MSIVTSPLTICLIILLVQIHCHPVIQMNTTSILVDQFSIDAYDATEVITNDSATSDFLMYYSWFAGMGYCDVSRVSEGHCCSELLKTSWEIINFGAEAEEENNNYIFLKSDLYKKFVFTFPGTRNPDEIKAEILKAYFVKFGGENGMKVSSFFKNRYDKLESMIFSTANIDLIKANPGYQVLFIGHSLGGAVASISALKIVYNNLIDPSVNTPVLITYNPPRTGNDIFAKKVTDLIPHVFRLVRKGDLVSNVPPCIYNLKGKCQTVLDSELTDKEIEDEENAEKDPLSFYYWHIGGQILMNEEMTEAFRCPIDQGENFDSDCRNTLSLNITLHNFIFNNNVGLYEKCTVNNLFKSIINDTLEYFTE